MDVYYSVDVENDGPLQGVHSMSAFAIVHAGGFDGKDFTPGGGLSFYRELRPLFADFDPETSAVSGLKRADLIAEGAEPGLAMREAAEWIAGTCGGGKPVMVGYPLVHDWSWLNWYFLRFLGASPFGHSWGYDTKTAYAAKSRALLSRSGRSKLPPALQSERPHTHHALDDAREQAEVFANIFHWTGPNG